MLWQPEAKAACEKAKIDISTLAKRIEHVMQATFAGRRIVVFSGGEAKDLEGLFTEIRALRNGGATARARFNDRSRLTDIELRGQPCRGQLSFRSPQGCLQGAKQVDGRSDGGRQDVPADCEFADIRLDVPDRARSLGKIDYISSADGARTTSVVKGHRAFEEMQGFVEGVVPLELSSSALPDGGERLSICARGYDCRLYLRIARNDPVAIDRAWLQLFRRRQVLDPIPVH
ncbi:MAG TPA: hypothetical protein VGJ56_18920 [Reyranella sp.]